MNVKKRISVLSFVLLCFTAVVACTTDGKFDKAKANDVLAQSSVYVADAAIIVSILPYIENDIDDAFDTVNKLKLSEEDRKKVNTAEKEAEKLIQDVKQVVSMRKTDIGDNLVYIANIDKYVGMARAIHKDIKDVIVKYNSSLTSIQLYRLKQVDAKLQTLNDTYNHLIESNLSKVDITNIMVNTLTLAGSTAKLITTLSFGK